MTDRDDICGDGKSVLEAFLANAVGICREDARIVSVLVGGSYATRATDAFSDLDPVIVCRDDDYDEIMKARREFARRFGTLLASFTGEHVGEPRLLICLYDDPLLHVDLKFVIADALAERVENPLIAMDKNGVVPSVLAIGKPEWPSHSPEWFEERFWIWMHYGAGKIARGELFESIDLLTFVRSWVLGPMIARNGGLRQRGVRQVEFESPQMVDALAATIPLYERVDCWRALKSEISLYEELRRSHPPANCDEAVERVVKAYIERYRV